ncbi:hypothetical protein E5720_03995 [Rhodococcus sp. PAMC28707]|uniref:hypothetical protein n=1 Tax=unclassified Rhodococcus (in: high G+C Gram-positive bacteria) TaxID=192944 RepID=UPI00109DBF7E|nr:MULTISPECIES: hypothetical protein [unclassified Rhodococcus (in: high G+C Gram-positive bacteria)]QCB50534.1 hypothetical protein E5769_10020 [Rhodococcus sp. PAMC28705]QCB57774.1 hypothetical protein E5720_03995 [Rhodococcus sp. PAMC28707]
MDPVEAHRLIADARSAAQSRLESLRAQFDVIVAGSEWTTDDDRGKGSRSGVGRNPPAGGTV